MAKQTIYSKLLKTNTISGGYEGDESSELSYRSIIDGSGASGNYVQLAKVSKTGNFIDFNLKPLYEVSYTAANRMSNEDATYFDDNYTYPQNKTYDLGVPETSIPLTGTKKSVLYFDQTSRYGYAALPKQQFGIYVTSDDLIGRGLIGELKGYLISYTYSSSGKTEWTYVTSSRIGDETLFLQEINKNLVGIPFVAQADDLNSGLVVIINRYSKMKRAKPGGTYDWVYTLNFTAMGYSDDDYAPDLINKPLRLEYNKGIKGFSVLPAQTDSV